MSSDKRKPDDALENSRSKAVRIGGGDGAVLGRTGCLHEVCFPPGMDGPQAPPPAYKGTPAKEYPFTLDTFQATSVNCLEAGESVLVAAHTSAGKTVVAEYAIAMSLREGARVVYTSPIKALSNQKFRELQAEFGDVGLMTGDVTINPNASCLVMTTEILRSMLYRGSELMREIAWVIYDEVHYLRDKERGVVWEESIIMVPDKARFVFLSATIPNAAEFASWIAKIHKQPCHVVYTDYRPTPLQHYLFPAGGDGLYMVVDEKSAFRAENFHRAISVLTSSMEKKGAKGKGTGKDRDAALREESDISKIVKMIMQRGYDPCIVFSFSKRECESLASQMEKMDLTSDEEKKLVEGVFTSAMDTLSEDDRRLPSVNDMLPLLQRGIGVHHSGLLPIMKEVIEIMFQEGFIKVLFATETFSIGLNMPARTCVFTSARKFDGTAFRWVTSGEYIQMSGRAGRRGLDDRGVVILMVDEKMDAAVVKDMVKGQPDTLYSAFHLGYNMLLNLMRLESADPEMLVTKSFRQYQVERSLPELERRVEELEAQRDAIQVEDEEGVREYVAAAEQLSLQRAQRRALLNEPERAVPFLQPGRLAFVLAHGMLEDKGDADADKDASVLGCVVNFTKEGSEKRGTLKYNVDLLLKCDKSSRSRVTRLLPLDSAEGEAAVVSLPLSRVDRLSSVRVHIPQDLKSTEGLALGLKTLREVQKRLGGAAGVQLLDPEDDLNVDAGAHRKIERRVETLEGVLKSHRVAAGGDPGEQVKKMRQKLALGEAVRVAKKEVKAAAGMICKDELKARRRLLRRLGYTTPEGVVEMKGRLACEISTGDELVATELILAGGVKKMTTEQLAALCSCLVCTEGGGSKAGTALREELKGPFNELREIARRVAKASVDCKLGVEVEEYVEMFKPDLMEVVYQWCRGAPFSDIAKMVKDDIFEGSLIRMMRRLEELLRQLGAACKSIGELELSAKFDECQEKIRRDIVFAASLYL